MKNERRGLPREPAATAIESAADLGPRETDRARGLEAIVQKHIARRGQPVSNERMAALVLAEELAATALEIAADLRPWEPDRTRGLEALAQEHTARRGQPVGLEPGQTAAAEIDYLPSGVQQDRRFIEMAGIQVQRAQIAAAFEGEGFGDSRTCQPDAIGIHRIVIVATAREKADQPCVDGRCGLVIRFRPLSPPGADSGVDIVAGSGALGLDSPRIVVQVKSGSVVVDQPTLQGLIGSIPDTHADHGLIVSWGGYTNAVRRRVNELYFRVRLWGREELVDNLFRAYDGLPEDIRAELPLRRTWTLVLEDEDKPDA